MYPTISSRTRKVELAADDITGIQDLYGSNPNYNGTSSIASQERDSSSGGRLSMVGCITWGLVGLMAVGLTF